MANSLVLTLAFLILVEFALFVSVDKTLARRA